MNYEANNVSYIKPKNEETSSYIEKDYKPHHQEFRCISLTVLTKTKEYQFEYPVLLLCTKGTQISIFINETEQKNKLEFGSVIYILPHQKFYFSSSCEANLYMCLNQ